MAGRRRQVQKNGRKESAGDAMSAFGQKQTWRARASAVRGQCIGFSDFEGVMAMQVLPTAFFIPVEGELVGEKLKLTLGPSRTDFNTTYTVAKGRYAVGGVLSMGVIVFTSFEVGFDTARGFIDKATDSDLGPITIPVAMGKTLMKAERTFTAQRNKNIAKGEYEVKITLCNPKCP
jgi:hypothetical protein